MIRQRLCAYCLFAIIISHGNANVNRKCKNFADQSGNSDRLFVVVLCNWRYTDKIRDRKTQTMVVLANQPCHPKQKITRDEVSKETEVGGAAKPCLFYVMILYHTQNMFVKYILYFF